MGYVSASQRRLGFRSLCGSLGVRVSNRCDCVGLGLPNTVLQERSTMAVFGLRVRLAGGEVVPIYPWLGGWGEVGEVSHLGSLGQLACESNVPFGVLSFSCA